MTIPLTLLQASQPSAFLSLTMPMIIVMLIFWFIVLGPERKRRRTLQTAIDNLKKGDKILTAGGLHGEVAGVDSNDVIVKIADNVKIKVAKTGIAGLVQP